MSDLGISVSEKVGMRDKLGRVIWPPPNIPKLCCPEIEDFFRRVIIDHDWVCPFCKTRVHTK